MLNFFRNKTISAPSGPPDLGPGLRAYAIGDIHGRDDLLERLMDMLAADHESRPSKPLRIVLLGDLVDRGPRSAQVIRRVMAVQEAGIPITVLRGNHEEVFAAAAKGDECAARAFCRIGGIETLASYGLDEALAMDMDMESIVGWMLDNVPRAHVDFIDAMPDQLVIGDYIFVHAGIRPRVPLADQDPADLRWIRREFLEHDGAHPRFVVHGHSVTPAVDERSNRIGIDTGAYFSNRLTALGLEGTARWRLDTLMHELL